jgi:hypothetical protein
MCSVLPVELLHVIAGYDMESYHAMLSLPQFARSLDPGIIIDFMISFGFGVEITRKRISWTRGGDLHRVGGPAVIFLNGTQQWYRHGKLHRDDGPAVIHPDGRLSWCQHGKYVHIYDPRWRRPSANNTGTGNTSPRFYADV